MLALVSALALLMGVILGLFGGGGSMLTVPILKYIAGMSAKEAIAASLVVVGVTSAFAVIGYARNSNVDWRVGFLFGGVSMPGALIGGALAVYFPGWLLLVLFAALMVSTSVLMLRKRTRQEESPDLDPDQDRAPTNMKRLALEGFIVGAVTGLIGASGGFIIVPALAILGGLPMHKAIGTSLMVITMKCSAAVIGHLSHVDIDWSITAIVTACAIVGSSIGAYFSSKVSAGTLRVAFAWFVLAMGTSILFRELLPIVLK